MIMKQVSNPTDNNRQVITFRKVLVNNSLSVGANAVPNSMASNAQMLSTNNPSNGVLTTSSNGFILPSNHSNGINSSVANGNARVISNGARLIPSVSGGTHNAIATGANKIVLTQQQLQKLLEQQLQQQRNGQPQIIRLQNAQQMLRIPQQTQQVARLPQVQPGQIIRLPQAQLQQIQQTQQLADGRIILPQPIQITPQQLQQIQSLQQKQNITTTHITPTFQQPASVAPAGGVQVISLANAQALLQQQQLNGQANNQSQVTSAQSVAMSVGPPITSQQLVLPSQQPTLLFNNLLNPAQKRTSTDSNNVKLELKLPTSSFSNSTVMCTNSGSVSAVAPITAQNNTNNNINNVLHGESSSTPNGFTNFFNKAKSNNAQDHSSAASNFSNFNSMSTGAAEQINGIKEESEDDDIEEIGQVFHDKKSTNGVKQEEEFDKEENGEGDGKEQPGVIDIVINNVVCSFSVGCHIDLREIAMTGQNVEYRREHGMVTMKLRKPLTTASIWSSGKITCTGSTSEPQAKVAARRVARALQKLGCNTKFRNFRIVNVLGTCTMPFAIKITPFSMKHRHTASYEPELHPGVTYKIEDPKATLKIFSTGSITVTAPSVKNVQHAIEHVYPLVSEFSKERTPEEEARRNASHFVHFHHSLYEVGGDNKRKKPKTCPPLLEQEDEFMLGEENNPFMSDSDFDEEDDDDDIRALS